MQKNKGLAPSTVSARMAGVLSCYNNYNLQLPVIPRLVKARPELKRRDFPTKDDIREILKYADPLERCILLVSASSGLSVIDIANLKVNDFAKGYDAVMME